ncbi:MAG: hypothetical protein KDB27_34690, partial [Planctomycetales bacterium]|nr:hypothetical protein [Planctomycetales bacterium]
MDQLGNWLLAAGNLYRLDSQHSIVDHFQMPDVRQSDLSSDGEYVGFAQYLNVFVGRSSHLHAHSTHRWLMTTELKEAEIKFSHDSR